MGRIKCCQFCVPPKRHTACWDTCPEYAEEKAKDNILKEADTKRRSVNNGIYNQRASQVEKALKRRRR
jgi:hypothetical protein